MDNSANFRSNAPESLTLSYVDSFGAPQHIEMNELNPVITIGSKPECTVMAANEASSPVQTIVIFRNGRLFAQDVTKKTPGVSAVVDGWTLPPGVEMEIQNTFTSCSLNFFIQKENKQQQDEIQNANFAVNEATVSQPADRYSSPSHNIAMQNNGYAGQSNDINMQNNGYAGQSNDINMQNNGYVAPDDDIAMQTSAYVAPNLKDLSLPPKDMAMQNNAYSSPANDMAVPANRFSGNRMPPVPVQDCMETGIYQNSNAVTVKFFYQDERKKKRCFVLSSQQTTAMIGRHPDCQIRTLNESVSRHHALLTWVNGRVFIEDPPNGHATNGVKVDGLRLQKGQKLEVPHKCSIFCGNYEIQVEAVAIGPAFANNYQNSNMGYNSVMNPSIGQPPCPPPGPGMKPWQR